MIVAPFLPPFLCALAPLLLVAYSVWAAQRVREGCAP